VRRGPDRLDEAVKLGLRRRIVLPFPVREFRAKSVTNRPGGWATCSTGWSPTRRRPASSW
jgi:hypothetical protein